MKSVNFGVCFLVCFIVHGAKSVLDLPRKYRVQDNSEPGLDVSHVDDAGESPGVPRNPGHHKHDSIQTNHNGEDTRELSANSDLPTMIYRVDTSLPLTDKKDKSRHHYEDHGIIIDDLASVYGTPAPFVRLEPNTESDDVNEHGITHTESENDVYISQTEKEALNVESTELDNNVVISESDHELFVGENASNQNNAVISQTESQPMTGKKQNNAEIDNNIVSIKTENEPFIIKYAKNENNVDISDTENEQLKSKTDDPQDVVYNDDEDNDNEDSIDEGIADSEAGHDEDNLEGGSGSGDKPEVLAETVVKSTPNFTSDEDDWFLDEPGQENITDDINHELPPYCEEQINSTWTLWSPWLQLGDNDFRFRRCYSNRQRETLESTCHGDAYEVRTCERTDARMCRLAPEVVTEEFSVKCKGIDIDDLEHTDYLKSPFDTEDECQFTLYDLKYKMAIGKPLSTNELHRADPKMWCFSPDTYMAFYSPVQRCRNQLRAFCKESKECDSEPETTQHHKPGLKSLCWRDSVIDGMFPSGIPTSTSQQLICQRFAKQSALADMFGGKTIHYATLYDTSLRMPVVSMAKMTSVGDNMWPDYPFMVETSLLEDETSSYVSWLFKEKKKGMKPLRELTSTCDVDMCRYGKRQATPTDFDYSGYIPQPLLSPDLLGPDLAKRISALAITNIVPTEPTVAPYWKMAIKTIRDVLKQQCSNDQGALDAYVLSGTAISTDHVEVIGNDVTVPEVIWLTTCCIRSDGISSFGLFTYNKYGQKPQIVSLENLQLLLKTMYYKSTESDDVIMFPAFEGGCADPSNDMSVNIELR